MSASSDYLSASELGELGFRDLGENVMVHRSCNIVGAENITVGSHVRIDAFTSLICAGKPCSIGSHVHISCYVFIAGRAGIILSDFSGVATGVRVLTTCDDFGGDVLTGPTIPVDLSSVTAEHVVFGRHAVVGANSVVLPGAALEEGVIVGALSLVNGRLEPWTIYAGSPLRKIKERRRGLLDLEAKLLEREIRTSQLPS